MKAIISLFAVLALLINHSAQAAPSLAGKKVLYVNSYHQGQTGSDDIAIGVFEGLKGNGLISKSIYMDTKRNGSVEFSKAAALRVIGLIEEFKPDIVIASDDNASKYVIQPYYKDAKLPFVFCGVNWDVSVYGFPYKNVTGVKEMEHLPQMIKLLKTYSKGNRIGFLGADTLSERKNIEFHQKLFGIQYTSGYFANTFDDYKSKFLQLQKEVDLIVMLSPHGITRWDDAQAKIFVEANATIPAGGMQVFVAPYTLLTLSQVMKEQGLLASAMALRILRGEEPSDIPVTENKGGKLYINMTIANRLGITFDLKLLKTAEIIR